MADCITTDLDCPLDAKRHEKKITSRNKVFFNIAIEVADF